MITLSADQQEAVDSDSPYLCILACAGSGKTTTLTRRLARLIASGQAQPSQIAAITFTKLAAEELLLRLATLVADQRALSEMFVGTIHSFCLHLLQDLSTGRIEDLRVLSENQQYALLNLHWDDWQIEDLAPSSVRSHTLSRLTTTLDIIRMEQIPEGTLQPRHPELSRIASSYAHHLRESRYVDFAGILVRVSDLLDSDPVFLDSVRAHFPWLFVDEYQDVDPVQEHIIRRVSDGQNLCVVGDDDQAIYQFRGTNVQNLLDFPSQYPHSQTLPLVQNRRCRRNVLAVAKHIVSQNHNRAQKQIDTDRPGGKVHFLEFDTVAEEALYICGEIQRLRAAGTVVAYSDIALLLRSVASYGDTYLNALRDAGIPYISKGARAMFSQPEIVRLVGCLEFLAKRDDSADHLRLLEPVLGELPDELTAEDHDLCDPDLDRWLACGLPETNHRTLDALLDVRERYRHGEFEALLEIVYDVIDILGILLPDQRDAAYFNTGMFTRLVSEFEEIERTRKLHRLCAHLSAYAAKQTDEATPVEAAGDAARVLTVHQAKGLEFQVVFCPMLVERRFPSTASSKRWLLDDDLFDSARYRNTIEDERRLFYVATTRAKSHLYLLCSRDVGLKNPVDPSEFFVAASTAQLTSDHTVDTPHPVSQALSLSLSTSYSAMEYYLTCPYRFKLLRVYAFTTPVNPFFEFGRVVHTVAALLHLSHRDGNPIDDAEIERIYEANFYMRYRAPAYVLATRKRDGLVALKQYWAAHRDWFDAAETVEQPFAYYIDGGLIQGRIDLLLRFPAGYEIVDLKTGDPQASLHSDFQMQTYSLAAREQLGLDVTRATLFYIEHDDRRSFDVTPTFLDTGNQELRTVLRGIAERRFHPTPGPSCGRCEFRRPCPYRT